MNIPGWEKQRVILKGAGMMKWLRYWLIDKLNRNPTLCWAELVIWAEFPENHKFSEIFRLDNFRAKKSNYCFKCLYIDSRKDAYKQAVGRVRRRGERRSAYIHSKTGSGPYSATPELIDAAKAVIR